MTKPIEEKEEQPLLPKGFRLNNATKALIVLAAAKENFEAKADAIVDEEAQFMHCISESLYSKEARDAYVQGVMAVKNTTLSDEFIFSNALAINVTVENLSMLYSGKKFDDRVYAMNTLNDKGTIVLGKEYNWRDPGLCTGQCGSYGISLLVQQKLGVLGTMGFWEPKCKDHKIDAKNIFEILPRSLCKELIEFAMRACEFRVTLAKFKTLLDSILLQYTSASKLVDIHPEFAPWIWKSLKLSGDPVTRCSDIPIVDQMQDVRAMLKAA